MAQEVYTAGANYEHPGRSKFTGELYIPQLQNITDPPSDATLPAIGSFDGRAYYWSIPEQKWQPVGSGSGTDFITGTYSTNGDGLTASFVIPVDLSALSPEELETLEYTITPVSVAAQGMISNQAIATGLQVNYSICPVGTLTYNYTIKLPA